MNGFEAAEARVALTCARHPAFPREPAVVIRLIKHLYKRTQDQANQVLRPWGVNHTEYTVLMMLFGSENYSLSPSELADAAMEKSTNITRLTDGLCARDLIARHVDEGDRRRVRLTLTPDGLAMIDAFLPAIGEMLARQTRTVPAGNLSQLETLLKRFLESVERG